MWRHMSWLPHAYCAVLDAEPALVPDELDPVPDVPDPLPEDVPEEPPVPLVPPPWVPDDEPPLDEGPLEDPPLSVLLLDADDDSWPD